MQTAKHVVATENLLEKQ